MATPPQSSRNLYTLVVLSPVGMGGGRLTCLIGVRLALRLGGDPDLGAMWPSTKQRPLWDGIKYSLARYPPPLSIRSISIHSTSVPGMDDNHSPPVIYLPSSGGRAGSRITPEVSSTFVSELEDL